MGYQSTNKIFSSPSYYKTHKEIIHKELSYSIVGILFEVYNELGYGYQERYYEKAVARCFESQRIFFQEQVPYQIRMKGEIIGRYYLDFLVERKVIVELKKGNYFSRHNIEQVKGYLKATKLELAILANFTARGVRTLRVLNSQHFNH